MSKITTFHLSREAYVYIRQSTVGQVDRNVESQRVQRRLVERAQELGWRNPKIIDEDLGCSASDGSRRTGFEGLLSAVCEESVGAIFAFEASRLARTGREWHTLLELCGVVNTLLIDPQGIYAPRSPDDRFFLGMKGSISEMELSLFRERSHAAIHEKARRGEYYHIIPAGYELTEDRRLEKTPDVQVQEALVLVLQKFRELGSLRQATIWFREKGVKVPVVAFGPRGRFIDWRIPGSGTVRAIVTHPIYAGAYSYGRRKNRVILNDGRKHTVITRRRQPEEWDVLLLDHHEGYIGWEEFLANQETIKENANVMKPIAKGSVGKGAALLAGVIRCGHCGRKMSVQYTGDRGRSVQYSCKKNTKYLDGELCQRFSARHLEAVVVESLLEVLSPLGVGAALEAAQRLAEKQSAVVEQRRMALARARYESDRIKRQYDAVEPENRLVCRQLESRWNEALASVAELEQVLERQEQQVEVLSNANGEALRALGADAASVWHHQAASAELKKRILRTVIKETVVYTEQKRFRLVIHWEGGDHTEHAVRRLSWRESLCQTDVDVLSAIGELARVLPDKRIAQVLNRLGKQTAQGLTWNQARVCAIRHGHEIVAYQHGERERRGELNLLEAARHSGMNVRTLKQLIERNELPARQACYGAPWIIRKADLDHIAAGADQRYRGGKPPRPAHRNQEWLDFQ